MDLCPPGQCGVRSLLTKSEPMATANGIIYQEAKITVAVNHIKLWTLANARSLACLPQSGMLKTLKLRMNSCSRPWTALNRFTVTD